MNRPRDDDVAGAHARRDITAVGLDDVDGLDGLPRSVDGFARARERRLLEGARACPGSQAQEAPFRDQGDDVECEADEIRAVSQRRCDGASLGAGRDPDGNGRARRLLHITVAARRGQRS